MSRTVNHLYIENVESYVSLCSEKKYCGGNFPWLAHKELEFQSSK